MDEERYNSSFDCDENDERLQRRQELRRQRKNQKLAKRRMRNRIVMVVVALAILLFIIAGISSCASSCSNKNAENVQNNNNSTESDVQTQPTTEVVSISEIQDNGQDGYATDTGIYIWNNQAFEMFYGDEDMAKTYASAVSYYRNQLDSSINVYNMVVPIHIAFGLPDRLENSVDSKNQSNYLNAVYNNYSADVKAVNIFDTLEQHKTEYTFFNTDHHWTALGAYYAYEEFCKIAGETSVDINTLAAHDIYGFVGSLYTATEAEVLNNNPDSIRYYNMGQIYSMNLMQNGSSEFVSLDNMYYENASVGVGTYSVFIWGDNPVTQIVNQQPKNGRKILVIKESYGNAFIPWLVNNYDEVHAIDFRYYTGNVSTYCAENRITDVLFINSVMSSANSFQIDSMSSLFA